MYMRNSKAIIFILLITSLLISGCATTRFSDADLTPEQLQLREAAETHNKTVVSGVAWGALIGGGLVALMGGDAGDIAAGAAVGGAAGGLAGNYYANKQKEYADEEKLLAGVLEDIQNQNEQTAFMVSSAEVVLAQNQRELENLQLRLADGLIEQDQLDRQIAIAKADQEIFDQTIEAARNEMKMYQSAKQSHLSLYPEDDMSDMDSELANLAQSIERLQELSKSLTESIEASDVS